jgi:hypothetical protein
VSRYLKGPSGSARTLDSIISSHDPSQQIPGSMHFSRSKSGDDGPAPPSGPAGSIHPQTALPSGAKAGSGRSGEVPTARQEWQDKHAPMKNYLQNEPRARIESVDGRALTLAHESLKADCQTKTERSSSERKDLGQKVRFSFNIAPFALRSKSDRPASNVMETLFKQPIRMTMFDAPEYQGPWRHDCAPKWTMGISDVSGPKEGESCPC